MHAINEVIAKQLYKACAHTSYNIRERLKKIKMR